MQNDTYGMCTLGQEELEVVGAGNPAPDATGPIPPWIAPYIFVLVPSSVLVSNVLTSAVSVFSGVRV